MHPTLSLMRREFSAYFLSPIGYVVFTVFLVVTGHLFFLTMAQLTATGSRGIYFPMQLMVSDNWFWLVFLFIPPLLTMRLFAEERASGTLEMLLTAPLRDWEWWTNYVGIDAWPVISTYLGLALAGAMFLSLGMFISSLVKSQMVAALVSLFIGLVFIVAGFWRPDMDTGSTLYQVLFFFTVPLHFERNFSRGLVDTRQLVLYASVALFCLFLTVRSLESRRWR